MNALYREEAEAMALLPDPNAMLPVHASTDLDTGMMICAFGRSGEDEQDWYLMTARVTDMESDFMDYPSDARDDACMTAAIVNAYRMGLLVPAPDQRAAVPTRENERS